MIKYPWAPIFTIERSKQPEITISGIIAACAWFSNVGLVKQVLTVGEINYQLWSRSLLKPWQLLSHLALLKASYPDLEPWHFALMTASHSGEAEHLCVLEELLDIGRLPVELLKCPKALPLDPMCRFKLNLDGQVPGRLFHNCSGKHLGYLLTLKAMGVSLDNYLDPDGAHFLPLQDTLSQLLGRPSESLQMTTDGCLLPNYALSAYELSGLYLGLMTDVSVPGPTSELLKGYAHLKEFFTGFPHLIGGSKRLDTKLMLGKFSGHRFIDPDTHLIAKEGADGLLALAIGSCPSYRQGIGILVKLASGSSDRYMEMISYEILRQLGVIEADVTESGVDSSNHINTNFHFQFGSQ